MAININDKKSLIQQILPEVDFNVTNKGLTISASQRLSTPRFIPFDNVGRCRECKATEAELDFVVAKEGVTFYCSRIKSPIFIPFDTIYDLPGHCFFKIRNKARVFNVMHGETPQCFPVQTQTNFKAQQKISKEDNRKEKDESSEKNNEKEENIEKNNEIKKEDIVDEEMEDVLKEFFDNIGEAITSTPIPGEKLQELQAQAIAMDDEMNNLLKNIPIDHTSITHTL
uniref:Uncharacterized protein n=2 Tax=Meloidogyne enterolobii TaxID=390850 RepID=A0A6V7XGK4_MELEN|nr:unnamed protein product [Meloidogyne enterolobii]